MWCWIWCWSAPDSLKTGDKDQPRTTRWRNEAHIIRLPPTTATYILVHCCCRISLPLIPITRLPPAMARYTRTTKHARRLLYFTNYHIHDYGDFRPRNKNARWIKTAQEENIYRPKKRCTWTRSTSGTNLTKDTMKRHNSMKEESGVKQQYSRTSIFGRIYQYCTTREQTSFTINNHHTTTSDNSRLLENMPRTCIQVLFDKRTQQEARGLHSENALFSSKKAHINKKTSSRQQFFKQHKIQDPLTFCSK